MTYFVSMNGDMIPDLMGENSGGIRQYWIFQWVLFYFDEKTESQFLKQIFTWILIEMCEKYDWHQKFLPYMYMAVGTHMNIIWIWCACNLPSTQCELDLINTNLLYAVYSLLFLFILILDMKTWCKLFVNYIKYWVNFLKTPTQSNFIVYSDGCPLECFFFFVVKTPRIIQCSQYLAASQL